MTCLTSARGSDAKIDLVTAIVRHEAAPRPKRKGPHCRVRANAFQMNCYKEILS
jgi:hypothetical protein